MTHPPQTQDGVAELAAYARRLEQERAQTTDEDARYRLGVTLGIVRGQLLKAWRRRGDR
jgi:hypothetical protein